MSVANGGHDIMAGLCAEPAEQALLGAMLISNRLWGKVSEIVRAEDFAIGTHQRIYKALGHIIERGGEANPVTLAGAFNDDAGLRERGGSKYLAKLASCAITLINAEDYARLIADRAKRRAIVTACQDTIADAATIDVERPADVVLEELERLLTEAAERREGGGAVSFADALASSIASCEAAYRRGGGLAGLSSGFPDLDNLLGGFTPGDLVVIAARPAMGKSALALDIAEDIAGAGHAVGIFSLEMSAEQFAQRSLAHQSGVSVMRQSRGDLDDTHWRDLIDAQASLNSMPVYIDDTAALSMTQIRQRARRMRRRSRIEAVVIDHLQLMRPERGGESRRLEIDAITGGLKALAKELGLPIILLSQLNRALEARPDKRPILADLRESGSIEQDADRVIFLYREEYYLTRDEPDVSECDAHSQWQKKMDRARGIAQLIVSKNRHGATGDVRLHWDAAMMQFRSLARA